MKTSISGSWFRKLLLLGSRVMVLLGFVLGIYINPGFAQPDNKVSDDDLAHFSWDDADSDIDDELDELEEWEDEVEEDYDFGDPAAGDPRQEAGVNTLNLDPVDDSQSGLGELGSEAIQKVSDSISRTLDSIGSFLSVDNAEEPGRIAGFELNEGRAGDVPDEIEQSGADQDLGDTVYTTSNGRTSNENSQGWGRRPERSQNREVVIEQEMDPGAACSEEDTDSEVHPAGAVQAEPEKRAAGDNSGQASVAEVGNESAEHSKASGLVPGSAGDSLEARSKQYAHELSLAKSDAGRARVNEEYLRPVSSTDEFVSAGAFGPENRILVKPDTSTEVAVVKGARVEHEPLICKPLQVNADAARQVVTRDNTLPGYLGSRLPVRSDHKSEAGEDAQDKCATAHHTSHVGEKQSSDVHGFSESQSNDSEVSHVNLEARSKQYAHELSLAKSDAGRARVNEEYLRPVSSADVFVSAGAFGPQNGPSVKPVTTTALAVVQEVEPGSGPGAVEVNADAARAVVERGNTVVDYVHGLLSAGSEQVLQGERQRRSLIETRSEAFSRQYVREVSSAETGSGPKAVDGQCQLAESHNHNEKTSPAGEFVSSSPFGPENRVEESPASSYTSNEGRISSSDMRGFGARKEKVSAVSGPQSQTELPAASPQVASTAVAAVYNGQFEEEARATCKPLRPNADDARRVATRDKVLPGYVRNLLPEHPGQEQEKANNTKAEGGNVCRVSTAGKDISVEKEISYQAGHNTSAHGVRESSDMRGFGRQDKEMFSTDGFVSARPFGPENRPAGFDSEAPEEKRKPVAVRGSKTSRQGKEVASVDGFVSAVPFGPENKPAGFDSEAGEGDIGHQNGDDAPAGHHTSTAGENSDSSNTGSWSRSGRDESTAGEEVKPESVIAEIEKVSEESEKSSSAQKDEPSQRVVVANAQPAPEVRVRPEPEFDRRMVAAMAATPVEMRNSATMRLFSGHHQMISRFRDGSEAGNGIISRKDMEEVRRSVNSGMSLQVGGTYSYMGANGSRSSVDLSTGATGYKDRGFGFETGVFHVIDTELLAGLMLSGQHSHASYKGMDGSVDVETVRMGPFVSWKRANFHIDAALTAGYSQSGARGYDRISGDNYRGENGMTDWAGWIGTGYDIHLDNHVPGLTVTPMAEFMYIDSRSSALSLKNQDKTRVKVRAGSRHDRIDRYGLMMNYMVPGSSGDTAIYGGAGAQHNHFASHKVNMSHADGFQSVTRRQDKTDRRLKWVSMGMSQKLGEDRKISFDLESTGGRNTRSYGASATFEYKFK